MHYIWENVGNQDECIRKLCYLGPYLLEHVEEEWDNGKLMMASRIYLWDDENKIPDLIKELPLIEYKNGESLKGLEDWYACNVLLEELMLGDVDVKTRME